MYYGCNNCIPQSSINYAYKSITISDKHFEKLYIQFNFYVILKCERGDTMKISGKYTYKWKDIKWLDFILPVIYLVSTFALSLICSIFVFILYLGTENKAFQMNDHMLNMIQLIVDLIAFIILFGTWILFYRRSFKDRLTQGIKHMKRYWKLIILTFIVLFILKAIYPELVDLFAPESWKFDETENDKLIEQMFATPFSTFLAFFSIVIIAPINEEFLFRHLLIGELGKKFSFTLMSIISVIIFASLHVTEAKSPLEIVMYLIIAIGLAYVYLKSGRKLSVAIALHALNNLIAYCAMVFMV